MRKRACVFMNLNDPTKKNDEEELIEFTEPAEIEEWETSDDLPF